MRFLKTIIFLFLAIIYSMTVYPVAYDGYGFEIDEKTYFYTCASNNFFQSDIRSKALTLMDMIDQNKNKSKEIVLSVLLEIELNNLESEIKSRIDECKKTLNQNKESLGDRTNNLSQDQVRFLLNNIEFQENKMMVFKESLYLSKQWKKDFCR